MHPCLMPEFDVTTLQIFFDWNNVSDRQSIKIKADWFRLMPTVWQKLVRLSTTLRDKHEMLANSSKLNIIKLTFAAVRSELTYVFYSEICLTFNRIIKVISLLFANHWLSFGEQKAFFCVSAISLSARSESSCLYPLPAPPTGCALVRQCPPISWPHPPPIEQVTVHREVGQFCASVI